MTRNENMTKCAIDYEWRHQDEMTDPADSFMLRDAYCRGWKAADNNPVNPWISVEERLPEIDREVYLYHYGYFEIARRVVCKDRIYNRDGTHSDTIEWKISHGTSYSNISEGDYWMPIPSLKGGEV